MVKKLFYTKKDYIAYSQINQTSNKDYGIIFLPGLNSDMQGKKALAIKEFCSENDIEFTSFDYYGHGESSGKVEDGTIGLWKKNTLSVIDNLTKKPQILIGSSMGGWLMLLSALSKPERVIGLIGIAPAPDFTEELIWKNLSKEEQDKVIIQGYHSLRSKQYDYTHKIRYDFIKEARNHLLLNNNININCPLYLLHGMKDLDVPYEISSRIAERVTGKNVEIHYVKDADHRFSLPSNITLIKHYLKKIISDTCYG